MKKLNKIIPLILLTLTLTGCDWLDVTNVSSSEDEYSSIDDDYFSMSYGSEEEGSLWDASQNSLRKGKQILDFYNFNDFHGATEYFDSGSATEPGIKRLSTYIKTLKENNPSGFVLTSSGDMWQGSADSNITRGRLVVDWMNLLEFDAQAVGNHEFDWTIDTIKTNKEMMNFPLLACNIIDTNSNKPVEWAHPYTTITRKGVHIGIVGAIGEGLTSDIFSENVKGLKFDDPSSYVIKWSKYLKNNGADIVLYLLHDTSENVSPETAKVVDLGFSGHTHSGENYEVGENAIPFVQAYCNGKDIGHIRMEYNFDTKKSTCKRQEFIDVRYIKGDDSETSTLYQKYLDEEISSIKDRVVGHTPYGIDKYDIPNIYNQYAYKYYQEELHGDKEIFLVETNNARSNIPAGDITYGDVYKALPFDNYLTLVKVKGSVIINYLSSYSSSFWYLPKEKLNVGNNYLYNYVNTNNDYYILMIDYIAFDTYYQDKITIEKHYNESEDCLPRNIVSKYIYDYPNNIN